MLRGDVERIFSAFPIVGSPNEATTEERLILPVLTALGWRSTLPQQATGGRGRTDVPDRLLFASAEAHTRALSQPREEDRYRYGLSFVEAKRWQRPLDRGENGTAPDPGTPSAQMLRYLSRVEVASHRHIEWGILTNGRHWRLYWQGARSRSEEFFEVDLAAAAGATAGEATDPAEADRRDLQLRLFFLFFRPAAFLPDPHDSRGLPFLRLARDESRYWEERVSRDLGRRVFEEIHPRLLDALIRHDPKAPAVPTPSYLDEVGRAALTLLYRLLFVLYAEDRHLLPVGHAPYDDYSLRRLRQEVEARVDGREALSGRATGCDHRLRDLFGAVGEGDETIGLPPCDGGLFERGRAPLLERVHLPDADLVPLLDALSRRRDEAGRLHWINYRDLSVQHLGSLYERLLEVEPALEAGRVTLRPLPDARRTSGSYYTPEDLVRRILEESVGRLVAEAAERFDAAVEAPAADRRRSRQERLDELARHDPASRILDLKICDPAMGSGHFLVSLVDYLTDHVLEQVARVESAVPWAAADRPYRSPVAARLAAIRRRILDTARGAGWNIDEGQLDDRHLVRRILLKRVVYGVDKNPMAVELAKLSLWLHSFTAGAPLSFLDHHLRTGDSLYGEWIDGVLAGFDRAGALWFSQERVQVLAASRAMADIDRIDDSDISEVHQSKELFRTAETTLASLHRLFDLWHALRWLDDGRRGPGAASHPGVGPLLRGVLGPPAELLAGRPVEPRDADDAEAAAVGDLLARVGALTARERFFHWELAFPEVWQKLDSARPEGGFDAVIGNPPWEKIKLHEVEWLAARDPAIARTARAADRKRAIRGLERAGAPLWERFRAAREAAETAGRVARRSGDYPLLGRGDLNLYSLFVERARRLVHPRGLVGLLAPSGIACDKGAAPFFRDIAGGGHLAALYDFENRRPDPEDDGEDEAGDDGEDDRDGGEGEPSSGTPSRPRHRGSFFPDVDSRLKFSILVFGGAERRFAESRCAFHLHAVEELADPERCFPLDPTDFAAVNPNTGTAPVFRRRRDAEITTRIYRRLPVLVDRRGARPRAAWPIEYLRMFDMTTDSGVFRTAAELEAAGFYRVAAHRWRRGAEEAVPLFEGKMVQMYDHRAASIEVHAENLHRPAQPVAATREHHADPEWLPEPQFWVDAARVPRRHGLAWAVAFKDVTSPTNARTMIAAVVPLHGLGNTLPALLPPADDAAAGEAYRHQAPLLVANLNSLAFDYLARQKVQGQHLNLYILEQLPVVPAEAFERHLAGRRIADLVRRQVLHLSYTAADLAPFARDLGHAGPPIAWDDEDRRRRMAGLDALFFGLYGLGRDEVEYVLDQFPAVGRADRSAILGALSALAIGDVETALPDGGAASTTMPP